MKIEEKVEPIDFELLRTKYLMYVQILTIFAVGHFNFEVDPQFKINLNSLDITFKFKKWTLDIFTNNKKDILLNFKKDKSHVIMITASDYDIKTLNSHKKTYGVNEIVVANPFDEEYLERHDVYINIEDIDSFRRIQQVILKGMIYSDTKRDVCPFCGGKLYKDPYQGFYQCNDCMTQIKNNVCKETKESYFYTDIAHLKKYGIKKSDFKHGEYWFYEKEIESLMYYRNITKINHKGDIICPSCGKTHEK